MYGKKLSLRDSEILEDHLRGLTYAYGEHQYTRDDTVRIANAMCLWLLVLGDIAPTYSLERCFSMTNLVRWPGRSVLDLEKLSSKAKEILALIRSYDPNMGRPGFRAYKAWVQEQVPDFGDLEFIRPIVYRLYGGSTTAFRDLNTVLQFWTRLTLQDVSWVEDQQLADYLALEQEMNQWEYPPATLDCLRYIVTEWLRDFTWDDCVPDFSNGATSEVKRGKGVASKVEKGRITPELLAADGMLSNHNPYFRITYEEPTAVGQFVPKGIDKKRFISMEPTAKQYYQYGLFRGLDRHFKRHPEIHVILEDQDTSRVYCLVGSKTKKWSTIDLSSASDTVTWTLVKELFRDLPEMLRFLKLVRTKSVLVNGLRVVIEKYAPMGSSLCFPIECIVFAAIASYACHLAGIPQNFRVYGDDIVIDSRAFEICMELLRRLHFLPNREKSFGPYSSFLEACGMEAYCGVDVSPCRLSRRYDVVKLRKGMSPQQLEGSIELANRLAAYGLNHARRHVVADILRVYPGVPFSVDPERGIYHPCPTNQHLKCRWNRDLQRAEFRVLVSRTKQSRGPEGIRYLRTLEKIEHRLRAPGVDNDIRVSCGPTRDSLREEWVSVRDFL